MQYLFVRRAVLTPLAHLIVNPQSATCRYRYSNESRLRPHVTGTALLKTILHVAHGALEWRFSSELCKMRKRSSFGGDPRRGSTGRLHVAWWCVLLCLAVIYLQFYSCPRHLWSQSPTGPLQYEPELPDPTALQAECGRKQRVTQPDIQTEYFPLHKTAAQAAKQPSGQPTALHQSSAKDTAGNEHAPVKAIVTQSTGLSATAEAKITLPSKADSVSVTGEEQAFVLWQPSGINSHNQHPSTVSTQPTSSHTGTSSSTKQVCAGYLLGIGTTKGGTTALWGYLSIDRFHPHLLASFSMRDKELYWWMHSDPAAAFEQYDKITQTMVHPPQIARQDWQELFRMDSSSRPLCPAPEHKVMRGPPTAFKWLTEMNGTDFNRSELKPLYRVDITPEYMYDSRVPVRVRSILPEARMVILLRNPVTRTVSEWAMNWLQSECSLREHIPYYPNAKQMAWQSGLHTRVSEGIETYTGCYQKTLAMSGALHQEFLTCLGYDNPYTPRFMQNALPARCASGVVLVGHSVYADQLERWFELFPASQFKIWISEDFKAQPAPHMMQLVEWLGLDPALTSLRYKAGITMNHKLHPGRYEADPDPATLNMLQDFYAPHNERLFKLLEVKGFGDVAARMREVWGHDKAGPRNNVVAVA